MSNIVSYFIIFTLSCILFLFVFKMIKSQKKYRKAGGELIKEYYSRKTDIKVLNEKEKEKLISYKLNDLTYDLVALHFTLNKIENEKKLLLVKSIQNQLEKEILVYYLIKTEIDNKKEYAEIDLNMFKKKKYYLKVKNIIEDQIVNVNIAHYQLYEEIKKEKQVKKSLISFVNNINNRIEKQLKLLSV